MSSPIPVVICDDSRLARKQMASALRGWNVEVTFAEHGLEGLEAVRAGKGDILFLDLTMPIMDGYQVLERIRRDDLPAMVIVVSGDIQPEARQRVLELGALEFIKKPTSPEQISTVLKQYGLLSEIEHPVEKAAESEVLTLPDYYQEIANVAMGRAGELMARLLDTFVNLPIPKVEVMPPALLEKQMFKAIEDNCELVSQGFVGSEIAGEVLLSFNRSSYGNLSNLMHDEEVGELSEAEMMMSLSNALIGAFISSFSQQLDLSFSRATPEILRDFSGLSQESERWSNLLTITIAYHLEKHDIACELIVAFTEDSLPKLKQMTTYF